MSAVAPLLINDVHKNYGNHKVLQGVNFSLNSGEIFGLIGLNGAGKTTLIKIMLDLISCENGGIEIAGISGKNSSHRVI